MDVADSETEAVARPGQRGAVRLDGHDLEQVRTAHVEPRPSGLPPDFGQPQNVAVEDREEVALRVEEVGTHGAELGATHHAANRLRPTLDKRRVDVHHVADREAHLHPSCAVAPVARGHGEDLEHIGPAHVEPYVAIVGVDLRQPQHVSVEASVLS